tara:strand:- start:874 stop:1167 length:294 start_codon:yes stop_codon:yes gene_type:complete
MELHNIKLEDKMRKAFNEIALNYSADCSDFVCKLSYKYRDYLKEPTGSINTIIIDHKQFPEVNDYQWQCIGLNGDKCLMIFLDTEDEDDFTFYKLIS